MTTLELPAALHIGCDVIDRQHARFFSLLGQLQAMDAAEAERCEVSRVLAELAAYVHTHFRTEEELMESCGYPGLENHQLQHAKFAGRVEEFQRKYDAGVVGLETEILGWMARWLREHILQEDSRYAELLRGHGH